MSVCEVAHIPVLRSGSCVGHPNWDKVKENVCGWHLLGKEDTLGHDRHCTHDSTNKQTKAHTQKLMHDFNLFTLNIAF